MTGTYSHCGIMLNIARGITGPLLTSFSQKIKRMMVDHSNSEKSCFLSIPAILLSRESLKTSIDNLSYFVFDLRNVYKQIKKLTVMICLLFLLFSSCNTPWMCKWM